MEGSNERLPVELSGLPIFDRDRLFRGYRGFGVCRDIARIENLMTSRFVREPDAAEATPDARPENIVPFRNGQNNDSDNNGATLTPVERTAFREISSRLTARLQDADKLARAPIERRRENLRRHSGDRSRRRRRRRSRPSRGRRKINSMRNARCSTGFRSAF